MSLEVTSVYTYTCNKCQLKVDVIYRDRKPTDWGELHLYRAQDGVTHKELTFHLCAPCCDDLEATVSVKEVSIDEVQADEDLFDFGRLGDGS